MLLTMRCCFDDVGLLRFTMYMLKRCPSFEVLPELRQSDKPARAATRPRPAWSKGGSLEVRPGFAKDLGVTLLPRACSQIFPENARAADGARCTLARMSPLATYVVETLVTLVAITLLMALVLYAARRMGVGRPTGPLELVGRLPLDARRVIYLVRVDKKVLVLGASEAGLEKLGELDADSLVLPAAPGSSVAFRQVLERAFAKRAVAKRKSDRDDHAA